MLCSLLALVALQDAKDVVLAGDQAYMLLPPEIVCAPEVQRAEWAPFGRFVLAQRSIQPGTPEQLRKAVMGEARPPVPETSLVLWSAVTRQSKEIWRAPVTQSTVESSGWFEGTDVAYVVLRFQEGPVRTALYRIPGSTGRMESVVAGPSETYVMRSPHTGLAMVGRASDPRQAPTNDLVWSVLRSNGTMEPPLQVGWGYFPTRWSADGRQVFWQGPPRTSAAGSVPPTGPRTMLQYDFGTRALTEVPWARDTNQEPKPGPVRLEMTSVGVAPQASRQLRLRATEGESKPVVVSGDVGRWAELSPESDGVFFETSQTLFVRSIIKFDAAKYQEMRDAAARVEAISKAKQCATALHIYASDYDDTFPAAGDVSSLLMPYLKNADILAGFNYTFAGGAIKDIKDPANTPIGSVPGPGGNAVAYADGHVKWIPDR